MAQRATLQIIREEHMAVASVLRSILMMVDRGPGDAHQRFFNVLRAMLFYIDEFPERRHHPNESDLLFPRLARVAPELMPVITRLEEDHLKGEGKVRELQHLLLAWELIGGSRRTAFVEAVQAYVRFYLEHMRQEELHVLPTAEKVLNEAEWAELDAVFEAARDPLAGGAQDPSYEKLFSHIVNTAPAPIGVGA